MIRNVSLACIDHKFQKIFDLKDYLIDSGSGSRIRPRDGGADSAAFSERQFFKQSVSIPLI
jgi:hypothetical protein